MSRRGDHDRSVTATEVVVVGASAAGLTAAEAIRAAGHDGPITVIGREVSPPYVRPALSKALLHGTSTAEAVCMPPPQDDVAVRLGEEAVGLDRMSRRVFLASGAALRYDKLVIATGARARTMRHDGRGETVLRSLGDALAVRITLGQIGTAVIVGGGFVGFELASACVAAGVRPTILTRHAGLVPHLGAELSALLTRTAAAHGVDVQCGIDEVSLEGDPVCAVSTLRGATFEADLVITAIGCRPNIEWLAGSGAPLDQGVLADDRCRVDAAISAAGDVARLGGRDRTPFWTAALDQAKVAGAALIRGDEVAPYAPSDFVWTEGFGLTVNVLGPLPAQGVAETLEGDLAESSALLRWRNGDACTVAAVNRRISRRKLRNLFTEEPQRTPLTAVCQSDIDSGVVDDN